MSRGLGDVYKRQEHMSYITHSTIQPVNQLLLPVPILYPTSTMAITHFAPARSYRSCLRMTGEPTGIKHPECRNCGIFIPVALVPILEPWTWKLLSLKIVYKSTDATAWFVDIKWISWFAWCSQEKFEMILMMLKWESAEVTWTDTK